MPRPTSAARAPSSTTRCPDGALAKAIHNFRAGSRRSFASNVVPTASCAATASATTSGRSARAITARTPDHEAMRAAASFDAMPPLPRAEPVPPAMTPMMGSSAAT